MKLVIVLAFVLAASVQCSLEYPFGRAMLQHFFLEQNGTFINHGSYGSPPRKVVVASHAYSQQMDSNANRWFQNELGPRMDNLRKVIGNYIGAHSDDITILENASTAVNSVLRSLVFNSGDKLLLFDIAFGMVNETVNYLHDRFNVTIVVQPVTRAMFLSEQLFLQQVQQTLDREGPIRLASIDHITALPAVLIPIKQLIQLFKKRGIRVLIDGAHSIGQIPLNMTDLDPDFYLSNGHKWLFSPKGSSFLYAAKRVQSEIHPSIISFGYKKGYQAEFYWTGTRDYSNYLAMVDALAWRQMIGGEEKILGYMHNLAVRVGNLLSQLWKTEVLVPHETSLAMVSVRIPTTSDEKIAQLVTTLTNTYNTYLVTYKFENQWWARLSCQIYNEVGDYETVGRLVLQLLGK